MVDLEEVERVLREQFRLQELRANQLEIIEANLGGSNSVVILNTGKGKSLTFQLCAFIDSCYIVVSPLLSLIEDHRLHMLALNVDTLCIANVLPTRVLNMMKDPESHIQEIMQFKLIHIVPEKLQNEIVVNFLRYLNEHALIKRVIVDECHVVSQWGKTRNYFNTYLIYDRI